jgi:hypothetical protein
MPLWLLILLGRAASGERFRAATRTDYQLWFSGFALLPLFMTIWIFICKFIPDSTVSPFPFWLGLTILGTIHILIWLKWAQRLPVPILVLTAVISWALLLWFGWKQTGVL